MTLPLARAQPGRCQADDVSGARVSGRSFEVPTVIEETGRNGLLLLSDLFRRPLINVKVALGLSASRSQPPTA